MYSDSSHSVLAICETKHAKAKYWISIKSMKKMGEERKRTKVLHPKYDKHLKEATNKIHLG
jgi:hypothetical protein